MRNILWITTVAVLLATVHCQDSTEVKEAEPDKKIETKHVLVKETMESKSEEKISPKEVTETKKEDKTAMAEEEKPKTVEKQADEPIKEKEQESKVTIAVVEKATPQTTTASDSDSATTAGPKVPLNKVQNRPKPETKIPKTVNEDVPKEVTKETEAVPQSVNPEVPRPRLHPRKKIAAPKPAAEPEIPEKETKKEEKEVEKIETKELPKIDPTTQAPMKPIRFIQNKNIPARTLVNRPLIEKQSHPAPAVTEPSEETPAVETEKEKPIKPVEGVRSEIRAPHPLSHKPLRRNTRMPNGRDAPPHTPVQHRGNRQPRPLHVARREMARPAPVAKSQQRNPRRQQREERKTVNTPIAVSPPQMHNSIIVMKNGRVVPLTDQQQIDLDLIISSMVRTRRRSRF